MDGAPTDERRADGGAPFRCGRCGTGFAPDSIHLASASVCRQCGALMEIAVFPALFTGADKGMQGEKLVVDGESACFYHPNKKATIPCEHCGRFLCALCDIEMAGEHLCASCVEDGVKAGRLKHLRNEYVHYDSLALTLAVFPAIFVWPALITAPMVIYFAIRYWKRPLSVLPRSRWRFVVAVGLAVLELGVFGLTFASIALM